MQKTAGFLLQRFGSCLFLKLLHIALEPAFFLGRLYDGGAMQALYGGYIAVSYTHLDVYKRQI